MRFPVKRLCGVNGKLSRQLVKKTVSVRRIAFLTAVV